MKRKKTNVPKEPRGQARILQEIQEIQQQLSSLKESSPLLRRKSLWKIILKSLYISYHEICAIGGLLISIGAIYLSFSNFISIPASHSLKSNEPTTIPILIQNNSFINLYDVNIDAEIILIKGDTQTNTNLTIESGHILKKIPDLLANSSTTLLFNTKIFKDENFIRISEAHIRINIVYKALLFKKSFKEKFKFTALERQDGIYEYYPNVLK